LFLGCWIEFSLRGYLYARAISHESRVTGLINTSYSSLFFWSLNYNLLSNEAEYNYILLSRTKALRRYEDQTWVFTTWNDTLTQIIK